MQRLGTMVHVIGHAPWAPIYNSVLVCGVTVWQSTEGTSPTLAAGKWLYRCRTDSRFAPSQWETALLCLLALSRMPEGLTESTLVQKMLFGVVRHPGLGDKPLPEPMLTHGGRDKMAATSQPTFSNAFCCMKMYEFRLKFHRSLFLGVELTLFQHWLR